MTKRPPQFSFINKIKACPLSLTLGRKKEKEKREKGENRRKKRKERKRGKEEEKF